LLVAAGLYCTDVAALHWTGDIIGALKMVDPPVMTGDGRVLMDVGTLLMVGMYCPAGMLPAPD